MTAVVCGFSLRKHPDVWQGQVYVGEKREAGCGEADGDARGTAGASRRMIVETKQSRHDYLAAADITDKRDGGVFASCTSYVVFSSGFQQTALAVLLIGAASAAHAANARLSAIKIDDFGIVNDHYYRGAQPTSADYPDLAALGVKTVIDLTRDGRSDEEGLVEAAGMKFVRIPLTTTEAPAGMAITQFLALVTDPANQPVYVHCRADAMAPVRSPRYTG